MFEEEYYPPLPPPGEPRHTRRPLVQCRRIVQEHQSLALNPPAQATMRDVASMTTAAAAAAAAVAAAWAEARQQTMRRGPIVAIN